MASVYQDSGELDLATARVDEALELLRESGALESEPAPGMLRSIPSASRTRQRSGPDDPDTLLGAKLLRELGRIHTVAHRQEEAERSFESALRIFERYGAEADAALTKTDLAIILNRNGRVEEALRVNREALRTLLAVHGEGHPIVSNTRNNIGITLLALGEYDEAEQLFRDAIVAAERTYGPDHPALANGLSNLGKLLMDRGRFEEAAPFVRRAAELRRAASAPDSYNRIAVEMNLAGLELALGELDEAIAIYRDGLERFQRLTGPESSASARVRSLLGIALHPCSRRQPLVVEVPVGHRRVSSAVIEARPPWICEAGVDWQDALAGGLQLAVCAVRMLEVQVMAKLTRGDLSRIHRYKTPVDPARTERQPRRRESALTKGGPAYPTDGFRYPSGCSRCRIPPSTMVPSPAHWCRREQATAWALFVLPGPRVPVIRCLLSLVGSAMQPRTRGPSRS